MYTVCADRANILSLTINERLLYARHGATTGELVVKQNRHSLCSQRAYNWRESAGKTKSVHKQLFGYSVASAIEM